jgi:hypothetical protein
LGLGTLTTFAMSVASMLVVLGHRTNIREEVGRIRAGRGGKGSAARPPQRRI